MSSVSTKQVIPLRNITVFGGNITDSAEGDAVVVVGAGLSCTMSVRFAAPRSATANLGSTLNSMSVAYTLNSGTLASATPTLVSIQYVNNVNPSISANLLGAATTPFLTSSPASARAVVPIAAPVIDNEGATVSLVYVLQIVWTATVAAPVSLNLQAIEMTYTYQATPLTPSFTSIALTATSNQIVMGTGTTQTINAPTPVSSIVNTIPDSGVASTNFVMTDGAQTVNGVKTFSSSLITSGPTVGYTYGGSLTATAAATTATLNAKAGTVSFTGQTVGANAVVSFTINNNVAGSTGIVQISASFAAAVNANLTIQQPVVWNTGVSIVVPIMNNSATSSGAVNFDINFISFK